MHSQVRFHRQLFADHVRPHWCITGPVGPLGRTNQSWCGVKLLTMSISTHPVGCVHICHLLVSQHHSMHPSSRDSPPPACHTHPHHPTPPPPSRPPPIDDICDITGAVKNYFKTQLLVIHARDSYCILRSYKTTLLIWQVWRTYSVAQGKHNCYNTSIQYFLKY